MFRDWEDFYLIVGSSSGALIGLMFVVATLTAGLESSRIERGARFYFTPIVFHFAVVVVVSAIAVVPAVPPLATCVILALVAVIGCAYSIATALRIIGPERLDNPHWSDKYFYGILPGIAYLGLAGAVGAIWLARAVAPYAVGAVVLALLLIGIRDAWDLATTLVQGVRDRRS